MHPTLVLLVVGLTSNLLGEATPNLCALARRGAWRPIRTVLPAVTCTVQSTFVTGVLPRDHGCVANGWYFRDLAEIWFWRQADRLVGGEKVWEAAAARNPDFTCAKLFWWFNMYGTATWSVTPRPIYPADGRKISDIYTQPAELREELTARLGPFPLFRFWGPGADLVSSRWIAACAAHLYRTRRPTLTLVYVPHLDYNLQRLGPDPAALKPDLEAVDAICGELIEEVRNDGGRVVVLSEYGVMPVSDAVPVNRALREAGWLAVRTELGLEKLDAGASEAFAVADHQIAHFYVKRPALVPEVKRFVQKLQGVDVVLDEGEKRAYGLDHARSGELIAVARPDRWFSYYYWLDDRLAPDFARTVDIHRKPGYDPVELFLDPALRFPKVKIGWSLVKKRLGFRTLLDVVPLDPTLVKGSHGRITTGGESPMIISSEPSLLPEKEISAVEVKDLILTHVFNG